VATFEQTITSSTKRTSTRIDADGSQFIEIEILDAGGAVMYSRSATIGTDGTVKVLLPGGTKSVSPTKAKNAVATTLAAYLAAIDVEIAALTPYLGASATAAKATSDAAVK
jgi:hypothetical protein